MDPGEPGYRAHLIEQARRHVEKLPSSSGVCIDRLYWLRMFNLAADDRESWIRNQPARSLLNSWRDLTTELLPVFHDAGKVVFVNNHVKRIDLLERIDGIFDEFSMDGAALNLTALLTTDRPALGWVDKEESFQPDPDAFLQRYLYMGVFPMAPFPGNDHSLRPADWLYRLYADYGGPFDALRGRVWLLEPLELRNSGAKVNSFKTPEGVVYAIMLGGKDTSAVLGVPGGLRQDTAEVLHPGTREWRHVKTRAKRSEIDVPLVRGCALVRIRQ